MMKKIFLLSLFLLSIIHSYPVSIQIGYPYDFGFPLSSGNACSGTVLQINSCSGCVSYQWQKNGVNITGATGTNYTVTQSGTYSCIATDANSVTATSNTIQITVVASPPVPELTNAVNVGGPGLLDDCISLVSLNSSCYFIGAFYFLEPYNNSWSGYGLWPNIGLQGQPSGFYTLSLNSGCGATSQYFTIRNTGIGQSYHMNRVASITGKTNLCGADSIELCISNKATTLPTGDSEVGWNSYAWTRNGIAIGTSYRIFAKLPGTYKCLISNTCNSGQPYHTDSLVITNLTTTASITASGPTSICQGNSVTFTVTPTSGATYKWYKNSVLLSGATTNSLLVTTTGTYKAEVSYLGCSYLTTDQVVTVTTVPFTSIVTSVSPTILCSGGTTMLNASPFGVGYSFSWYLNGAAVSGASSSSYIPSASGNYAVKVTDAQGCSNTSSNFLVTYGTHNANISSSNANPICQGKSFTMTSNASGGDITGYQWKLNGSSISGATGSTYTQTTTLTSAGNYSVDVTNACGTFTSAVYTLNVNAGPATPAATYTGNNFFCTTGSVTLNSTSSAGLTYQWLKNGSVLTGSTNTIYSATSEGAYSIRHTNANGCSSTSNVVDVYSKGFAPVITPDSFTIGCSPFALSVSPSSGAYTYQWLSASDVSGPYYLVTGATSSSYSAPATSFLNNIFYKCHITGSCGTAMSNTVELNIKNTLPTSSILPTSGTSSYTQCDGKSVGVYAAYEPYTVKGISYQWTKNGVNISGAISKGYYPTTSGVYRCAVSNGCGTKLSTDSAIVTFNPNPVATITASGSTNLCNGSSVTLNANTGTGLTYQWTTNGQAITGATSSSYTTTVGGTYRCIVTSTGGCSTVSGYINVFTSTGVLAAAVTPSGTVTLCSGTSTTLSATAGTGYTYKWYRNTVLLTTTTQTFTTSTSGTYKCVVTSGSCTATSNNVVIVVNTTPNATVSYTTPLTFCSPGSVTFTANALSGAAYQWENNSIAIPGATAQTYVATGAGVYRVKETKNGCVDYSSAKTVTTATSVTAAITTADPVTQCTGGVVNMSITSPVPGYSHQWKKNNVNIAGATGTSYAATSTGSYTVTATAGCGTATSNAIAVTIGSVSAVVSPATSATLCTGGSVLLTANTGSGFTHEWKKNNVNIAGATTSTYTVTAAGSYTVAITAPCGSATSAATVVTQVATVTAAITPAGSSTLCSGSSITFTANTATGYTYKWYRNNVLLSSTGQTFTTGTAGSYKVEVSISGSCAVQSNTATLTVINNPTPTITAGGPTTFCAGQSVAFTSNAVTGAAYQWQRNSVNIAGATAQTYTATTAGSYRVQQTKSGCSKYSSKKTVTVNCRLGDETSEETGSDETNSIITMEVYPNPFTTSATIEIKGSLKINNATIEIYNLLGDIVKRITNVNSKTTTIEKEKMNAGVYNLLLTNGDGQTLNARFVVN